MEKNSTTNRAQVHTFVDRQVRDQLSEVARQNHRSVSGELRLAIHQHLDRHTRAGGEHDGQQVD